MTKKLLPEYRVVLNTGVSPNGVVAVQQKCLVQKGEMYSPPFFGPPENSADVFSHTDANGRPWWIPMEVKWMNLPTVTQEEAEKDAIYE